jgi:ACR3 family arsenite transporter
MAAGLGIGSLIPSLDDGLDRMRVGTVSLPIALGLLLMMYPVLTKVRYEDLGHMSRDGVSNRRFFGLSLFLSWVVGPAFMFALAWLFLADQPEYRTGVIIVGLARCIAMVLIWNDLALGDRDRAAVLVVFNALFQVVAYSLLGYFYLTVLPGWLGLDTQGFEVGIWEVARTVLIFLGIPLTAGYLTRRIGIKRRGREWFEERFIPRIAPITLYGLLFTIVLLFAIQGETITSDPQDCSATSSECGSPASSSAAWSVSRIHRRQASRSPWPATTSSLRSPSRWGSSGQHRERPSPALSGR